MSLTSKSCLSIALMSAVASVFVLGCSSEVTESPGPSSAEEIGEDSVVGDDDAEQLWDEGPLAEDDGVASPGPGDLGATEMLPSLDDEEVEVETEYEVLAAPVFQLPFPCNQRWSGQTRTGHKPQNSVDFNRANDVNDPVVAAAAGKVSRVANLGGRSYGRWIEINHGGGWTTRYAHLSRQLVRVGQRVARGQRIGNVGSTGGSSGPHLHYEVRKNGVAQRATFNGVRALYFGTRTYTSRNGCK